MLSIWPSIGRFDWTNLGLDQFRPDFISGFVNLYRNFRPAAYHIQSTRPSDQALLNAPTDAYSPFLTKTTFRMRLIDISTNL